MRWFSDENYTKSYAFDMMTNCMIAYAWKWLSDCGTSADVRNN